MTLLFLLIHLLSSLISLCLTNRNCRSRMNPNFDIEAEKTRCKVIEMVQNVVTFYLFLLQQAVHAREILGEESRVLALKSDFFVLYWQFNRIAGAICWSILIFMTLARITIGIISYYKNEKKFKSEDLKEVLIYGGWHLFTQWHVYASRRRIIER